MSFGRNPYVSKAQDVELKAQGAVGDPASEVRLWREAAHLWERAVAKEQPGKRRVQYEEAARVARESADVVDVPQGPAATSQVRPAGHLRLVPADGSQA